MSSDLLADHYEHHLSSMMAAPSGAAVGLPTGFRKLDKLTGGLSGAVAIASAPGGGKTTLALNLAAHVVTEGAGVLIASPELPRRALLDRLVAVVSGLKLQDIRKGAAADAKHAAAIAVWKEWAATYGKLVAIRGRDESLAFSELRERASILSHHASGSRVLAIVDGLQTYAERHREKGDQEKDALDRATSAWVDSWDVGTNVVSLLLSHVPKHDFGRHAAGVFAGSARIEYRVDLAIVLAPQAERGARETYPVTLHVTKNWNGPLGETRLTFDAARCRFKEP
jgi:replicative DNA helicase